MPNYVIFSRALNIIFVLKITVCNKLKDADPALYLITVFLKAPVVRTKGMCLR